jgi:hypothetical protein
MVESPDVNTFLLEFLGHPGQEMDAHPHLAGRHQQLSQCSKGRSRYGLRPSRLANPQQPPKANGVAMNGILHAKIMGAGNVSVVKVQLESELASDPRWQLVERVVSSRAFQKSNRLRDLLRHLAERSLRNHTEELTEHQIGQAVFGKSPDYSPNEDSSVRVHARQLRLKLHEYFDDEGRGEPLVIEIPKGSYAPVFRQPARVPPPEVATPAPPVVAAPRPWPWMTIAPWALSAVLAVTCLYLLYSRHRAAVESAAVPWPLSSVFESGHRTQIIVADINYGMLQFISQKLGSLEEYMLPNYQQPHRAANPTAREKRALEFLDNTLHTSYADVVVVSKLLSVMGGNHDQVVVRSARDLSLREIGEGNFVLVGSPASNPWVSLFESKLNFLESHAPGSVTTKAFLNKRPRAAK